MKEIEKKMDELRSVRELSLNASKTTLNEVFMLEENNGMTNIQLASFLKAQETVIKIVEMLENRSNDDYWHDQDEWIVELATGIDTVFETNQKLGEVLQAVDFTKLSTSINDAVSQLSNKMVGIVDDEQVTKVNTALVAVE
jgi:hypothetical protein